VTANNFDAACIPLDNEISKRFRINYEIPLFEMGLFYNQPKKRIGRSRLFFNLSLKTKTRRRSHSFFSMSLAK